jgi:signal transduction histidine kinase
VPRPRALDLVVAAILAVLGVGEVVVPFGSRQGSGSVPANAVAVLIVGITLLFRRRQPLLVVVVFTCTWAVTAVTVGMFVLFYGQLLPFCVALYTVARYGRHRDPWVAALLGAAGVAAMDLFVPSMREPEELFFHWSVVVVAWCTGFALRRYEARTAAATRRAVDAEVAATTAAMQAVVDERTRIARELHDIVAHAVSSMVVQAGAGEQVALDNPAAAQRALATIRRSGNDALLEMRRLVGILRDRDESTTLAPQPGMARLQDLVGESRRQGLPVNLVITGEERPLPAGLDLSLYRIIQEALTNVRRHASATRADVRVHYADNRIRLEVQDDGRGQTSTMEPGHGIIGMRERAALYGGDVQVGSNSHQGFVVRAEFPIST